MKLKPHRVRAGLTQAQLAKAVGVSQPHYHRWESGASSVPKNKLKKLAHALHTSIEMLEGTYPPIAAGFCDKKIDENLNYYGEVAIHFREGGKPLLLSISDGAFSRLYRSLQKDPVFFCIESLANQTVIVRNSAISDLYFSSEAYDNYGPEHAKYEGHLDFLMPDPRDWEIVEAIAHDLDSLGEFAESDLQRVSERIMITDEQYDELVAEGLINADELESEQEKNQRRTDRIFSLATSSTYQLSNGTQRTVSAFDYEDIFEAFEPFLDIEDFGWSSQNVLLPIEGWHRTAVINMQAIDYVMLPTHRISQGRTEYEAKLLDEFA